MPPSPDVLEPVTLDVSTTQLPLLGFVRVHEQAIDAKAAEFAGALGPRIGTGTQASADGVGFYATFQHGWVMWRSDRGPLVVHGAIGAHWNELGGTASSLGWPQTDELASPRGLGRLNHFDGGSIYWGPATGAHAVYGDIRDKWASLGWEQGGLGLPTSGEHDVPGAPGARRNTFEGGDITWTPWSGARVTRLANVHTQGGGITIQTTGSGGQAVSAPQVSRHVIVSAAIDMTDHETFGSDEHDSAEGRAERWVDSWDPQGVMHLEGTAGDEMRVELNMTASVRPDGGVRIEVAAKLFEGTSVTTDDLDGRRIMTQVVPADQTVQFPIRIKNDDEGGDFADISITVSNSST